MLRGPAHPENFRQQVGRYGDRHYVDNLPDDGIFMRPHGLPMQPLPSVSVIKQAYPKFLTDWAAQMAAQYAVEHQAAWSQLPMPDAVELISKAAVRQRDRAAQRGSDVHSIIEGLATGHVPDYMLIDDAVRPYVPCIEQLVKDLRLVPHVLEAVVFNHDVGYGGTFDFIGSTVHGVGLLDWKTRKNTTRYDEEAAQVAAYAGGDYMIVESELGGAMRAPLPKIDYLGVVVISPEGYQVHEVNEVAAWELWTSLVGFWNVKSNGGPFYEGALASPRQPLRIDIDNIRERILALPPAAKDYLAQRWPAGLPTLKQNPTDYDLLRIEQLLIEVEAKAQASFTPVPLDEGDQLDVETWRTIDQTYRTLDWHIRRAVDYHLEAANPPVRMGHFMRTVRRFEILRFLIYLAEYCDGDVGRMGEFFDMSRLGLIKRTTAAEMANDLRSRIEAGLTAEPAVQKEDESADPLTAASANSESE